MDEQRLTAIDHRVQRIHNVRPLPPETRRSLAQALRTRITYASNAIEGNRLTLAETQVVLEGVTVGGKPLTDHLEAIDHAEAWDAVIHWSRVTEPLTPHLLRSLHALVLRRSRPDESGRYRSHVGGYRGKSAHSLRSGSGTGSHRRPVFAMEPDAGALDSRWSRNARSPYDDSSVCRCQWSGGTVAPQFLVDAP